MSSLGVYIHIPYCLQRCTYCDFATYVHTEIRPPQDYMKLVKKEISIQKQLFQPQPLTTLYFGGGTPSLLPAVLIVELIQELAKFGYTTGPQTEITIEINPATIDEKKLEVYLKAGVNRFSVGAQTFADRLLKMVHREHNAQQTRETLHLLQKYNLNYSFDLLFALPTQTLGELRQDLEIAVELGAKHISPYCLTVPEGHPLSKNRPLEEEQIEMFQNIDQALSKSGFQQYEISNYALKGFESKHNLLYWTDEEFWGLGLSAHSYKKTNFTSFDDNTWGSRFWNINSLDVYARQIENHNAQSSLQNLQKLKQIEILRLHQALTDFCHTSLRLSSGLNLDQLQQKFAGPLLKDILEKIKTLAQPLVSRGLFLAHQNSYVLSEAGRLISNQIFEKFTFLEDEI